MMRQVSPSQNMQSSNVELTLRECKAGMFLRSLNEIQQVLTVFDQIEAPGSGIDVRHRLKKTVDGLYGR